MQNKKFVLLLITLLANFAEPESPSRYNKRLVRKTASSPRLRFRKLRDCIFSICEHVASYPENDIKTIIEENKAVHSYFGNIIEPSNTMVVSDRFGGSDYEPFCKTVDISTVPKFMRDVDNVERAIANVAGYHQVVKFQTCDFSNGEECFAGKLVDRNTACVQKFNTVKLLTANVDNKSLEYRKFKIPSTCVCAYVDQ
ncbi:hypothetical protein MTP99_014587 [Tenebrio molitor]|jgi:hypothetical protein|nr:hypothetical protein MTP99_014587 [Tenebrio molitor]